MRIELDDRAGMELRREALLRLPAAAGTRITCLQGAVWITEDNLPRDTVLQAGQSYVTAGTGPVIVHAFDESTVCFVGASAPRSVLGRAVAAMTRSVEARAIGDTPGAACRGAP